ncbi:unnamed protein product [Amoebophrya sp. A120]|nr:unnamed protein product [Amoebophrya sp. A120]|eukprot:GSA120T00004560001.1
MRIPMRGKYLPLCFGTCNAVNRISRWICYAAFLAKLHYNIASNLSCVGPKTSRFVLQNPHLDSGMGTLLQMIRDPDGRRRVENHDLLPRRAAVRDREVNFTDLWIP